LRRFPAVRTQFWPVFRAWRVPEDQIELFAQGLQQAGVIVERPPALKTQ
jgi:hypothetical protein